MKESSGEARVDRPLLPRDEFRAYRIAAADTPAVDPLIVTPSCDDDRSVTSRERRLPSNDVADRKDHAARETAEAKRSRTRNPFDAYGERSSSRPYSLRLPDAIDFVLRQMAAEERAQPLRVLDRILYDYLKRIGRLPPPQDRS